MATNDASSGSKTLVMAGSRCSKYVSTPKSGRMQSLFYDGRRTVVRETGATQRQGKARQGTSRVTTKRWTGMIRGGSHNKRMPYHSSIVVLQKMLESEYHTNSSHRPFIELASRRHPRQGAICPVFHGSGLRSPPARMIVPADYGIDRPN